MKYKIPLQRLDMEAGGCHLLIEARMGREKLRLVVDSGASKTTLDQHWLKSVLPGLSLEAIEQQSAGLGTSAMESALALLPEIKLGKLKVRQFTVAVMDLSHICSSYEQLGYGSLHGVLGGDFLSQFQARIQYHKNRLVLEDAHGRT
jgi:hypothetical protein